MPNLKRVISDLPSKSPLCSFSSICADGYLPSRMKKELEVWRRSLQKMKMLFLGSSSVRDDETYSVIEEPRNYYSIDKYRHASIFIRILPTILLTRCLIKVHHQPRARTPKTQNIAHQNRYEDGREPSRARFGADLDSHVVRV